VAREILIAFFDSRHSAQQGLAVAVPPGQRLGFRHRAVLVTKETDGSPSPIDPPWVLPASAVTGAGLGCLLGLLGGQAGVVVGLFFGLYAGVFVDLRRTLTCVDLLDEIQAGLAPGHAALVTPVRGSCSTIEGRLAATDAVIAHRFPGIPIEDDFAREVRDCASELGWSAAARDSAEIEPADRHERTAAARRKLAVLEPYASRLLWLERLQFEFEMRVANRGLRDAPRWRASCLRRRVARLRADHRHARAELEASSSRIRAAGEP